MKALLPVLIWTLLGTTAASAVLADANSTAYAKARVASSPHTVTAAHQPSGKPTKASSFAPHSGGSHRHVYGAPIQSPIFHSQPKKPLATSTPK